MTGFAFCCTFTNKKSLMKCELLKNILFGRTWENGQSIFVLENLWFVDVIPRSAALFTYIYFKNWPQIMGEMPQARKTGNMYFIHFDKIYVGLCSRDPAFIFSVRSVEYPKGIRYISQYSQENRGKTLNKPKYLLPHQQIF